MEVTATINEGIRVQLQDYRRPHSAAAPLWRITLHDEASDMFIGYTTRDTYFAAKELYGVYAIASRRENLARFLG